MATTPKTAKKAAKKKAAPKANGAATPAANENPAPKARAPFEPILQVNCGEFGKWGLHLTGQGLVAAYQLAAEGWQQSPAFPVKLAEYIEKFIEQHSAGLNLEGYFTPATQAQQAQRMAQQEQQASPPPAGNRKQRRASAAAS
jgi:hypothetical protein